MNITDDEALGFMDRLLEWLRQADLTNFGSRIEVVYVAPGAQHVDHIGTQVFGETHPEPKTHPVPPCVGREKSAEGLPDELATDKAMALWRKAQQAGYVNEHYQPLLSRTQAALLADAMAERLGIKEKWKVFGDLWKRNNMRGDYTRAMNQRQSLGFQDKLKRLFSTDNEENTGKT